VVGLEDPSTQEEAEDRSGVVGIDDPLTPFAVFSLPAVGLLTVDADMDLFGVDPPTSSSPLGSVPVIFVPEALFCNQPPKPPFCPEDVLLLPSPVSPIFDCAVAEVTACTKLENEVPNDKRPNAGLEVDGEGDGGGVDTDFSCSLKSLKLSPSSGVSVDVDSTGSGGDVPFRLGVGGGVSIATDLSRSRAGSGAGCLVGACAVASTGVGAVTGDGSGELSTAAAMDTVTCF